MIGTRPNTRDAAVPLVPPGFSLFDETLRDGLTFHDGKPVTSADCIASIERWMKKDSLGAEISHIQTKTPAEFEENFRQYGAQGYSIVFGHGFEFQDAIRSPQVEFFVTNHQWLDVVRRLRCRPESFADDGPERAADALERTESSSITAE